MIEPPRPVSLIPESAPFSAEQRLWLSGYRRSGKRDLAGQRYCDKLQQDMSLKSTAHGRHPVL